MESNAASTEAKAALIRAGQTREAGCLSIIDGTETVLIFTGQGLILNMYKDGIALPEPDLDEILGSATAHLWIADAKPPKVGMATEIASLVSRGRLRRRDASNVKTAKLAALKTAPIPKPIPKALVFYLSVVGARKRIPIDRPTLVMGRDKGCDIVLSHRSVSRRHCVLQLMVRGLYFRDLASSNGIYVNDSLSREGFLLSGDQLALGHFTLEVCTEYKTKHLPNVR